MKAGGLQEKLLKGGQAAARRVSSAFLATYFQAKLDSEIVPHDLKRRMDAGGTDFLVLDVRDPDAFKRSRIPGAKFAAIEGCGHFPMVEKPNETAELVSRFLESPHG